MARLLVGRRGVLRWNVGQRVEGGDGGGGRAEFAGDVMRPE